MWLIHHYQYYYKHNRGGTNVSLYEARHEGPRALRLQRTWLHICEYSLPERSPALTQVPVPPPKSNMSTLHVAPFSCPTKLSAKPWRQQRPTVPCT